MVEVSYIPRLRSVHMCYSACSSIQYRYSVDPVQLCATRPVHRSSVQLCASHPVHSSSATVCQSIILQCNCVPFIQCIILQCSNDHLQIVKILQVLSLNGELWPYNMNRICQKYGLDDVPMHDSEINRSVKAYEWSVIHSKDICMLAPPI